MRALLSHVVGRAVVQRVAPLLSRAGIPVMPLKGVWLQARVYGEAGGRVITDVDLLVPEAAFARSIAVLTEGGWKARAGNASEISLEHPDFSLLVDLHCRLFRPGAFALSTAAVFERSTVDRELFGVELFAPCPLDVFAHLLGHFVKSRTRRDDHIRLRDFTALAHHFNLDAVQCARHLHAAGMARAARYVLPSLTSTDTFCAEVLSALPRDPAGRLVVALAGSLAERSHIRSLVGALPGFLLERSLAAGARSLLLRFGDGDALRV